MKTDFYIYVHRKLSDNKPFYVGKGSGNRAFDFSGRNKYWKRVKDKHGIKVEIVFDNLSEDEAFQCEIDTLLEFKYFGYELTNMTNGGEGPSGLNFSDEQRLNIANGLKSKRYSDKSDKELVVKRPSAYGQNNHFADKSIYDFVRLQDGLQVTCSRHELCEMFNVDKYLLKKLFYKQSPRKSADGWRLKRKDEYDKS